MWVLHWCELGNHAKALHLGQLAVDKFKFKFKFEHKLSLVPEPFKRLCLAVATKLELALSNQAMMLVRAALLAG